jgi:hypothetical protein
LYISVRRPQKSVVLGDCAGFYRQSRTLPKLFG